MAVGRDADRYLVAGYATQRLAALRHAVLFVDGDERLVEPDPAPEHDGTLAPVKHGEYLLEPINARRMGVSVVSGRGHHGVELE